MKKLIFILFVFCFANGFSQTGKPKFVDSRFYEKIFPAKIDGKYAITIYVKLHEFFSDNSDIYSVKGWYYYDNKKINIPLVGIFDGELTLFASPTAEKSNSVIHFKYPKPVSNWDITELLKDLPGYSEKFVLANKDEHSFSGKWYEDKTELDVVGTGQIEIYNRQEFLKFQNGEKTKTINLYQLNLDITDFSFKSFSKFDGKESRVLLGYSFVANSNHMGKCGAGYENGYVILHFDKNLKVLSAEDFRTDSCLENIEHEIKGKDKHIVSITKFEGKAQVVERIKIDIPNAKIIKLNP